MAIANQRIEMPADLHVRGRFWADEMSYPDGSISDADVAADAAIAATKLVHQFPVSVELAEASTAVAAITKLIHLVNGVSATIVGIEGIVVTAATGADRTVSVDLKKSTGGGAFATVLSATVDFDNTSTALTSVSGTVSSASLVAGDILEAVVTVAGAAGNQAKGLLVTVFLREDPA